MCKCTRTYAHMYINMYIHFCISVILFYHYLYLIKNQLPHPLHKKYANFQLSYCTYMAT